MTTEIDTRCGRELGFTEQKGSRKFILRTCQICHQSKWMRLDSFREICKTCSLKQMHEANLKRCQKGEMNPNWHGGRVTDQNGYILVRLSPDSPFYPMAHTNGYVGEHRLVMAKKLGRCLNSSELVHHINGRRDINVETNLELKGPHLHRQSYTEGFNEGFKVGQRARITELEKQIRLVRLQLNQLRELLQPQLLEVHSD